MYDNLGYDRLEGSYMNEGLTEVVAEKREVVRLVITLAAHAFWLTELGWMRVLGTGHGIIVQ